MNLSLLLHIPTNARYIVLRLDGIVQQAAGPLSAAQIAEAQRDEWTIPWQPKLDAWVEERRDEFEQVWPPENGERCNRQ